MKIKDCLADGTCENNMKILALESALQRARTILNNMAWENESAIFNRWQINHEPLRADAKALLPLIDTVLRDE